MPGYACVHYPYGSPFNLIDVSATDADHPECIRCSCASFQASRACGVKNPTRLAFEAPITSAHTSVFGPEHVTRHWTTVVRPSFWSRTRAAPLAPSYYSREAITGRAP